MPRPDADGANLDPQAVGFFRHAIEALRNARLSFLVGGAYAFEAYTGIAARTKDLDLFIKPSDVKRALEALAGIGYETELTSPVWIGKAYMGNDRVDLIFASGNGICVVDDSWFEHAGRATVLGYRLPLIPREEMIWSKSFLMERDRFDGADIQHLIRSAQGALDGKRLLARFGIHWRVLLAHVILFDYVYPSDRALIPAGLRDELLSRAAAEGDALPPDARTDAHLCFGTFLSRHSYLPDIEQFGLVDARNA